MRASKAGQFQVPKGWSAAQRLDHYSIPEALTGCHLCWASQQSDGYPNIRIKGRFWLAHRLAWTVANGPIPDGKEILHRCNTRQCINPDHLFAGDDQAYGANKIAKGVQARGERISHKRKGGQSAAVVKEIFAAPGLYRVVAERFATSISTVQSIKSGRSWSHVTGTVRVPQVRNRKPPSVGGAAEQAIH